MTAKYDSALCARLIAEAREGYPPLGHLGDCGAHLRMRVDLSRALADQLSAARAEIERMTNVIRDARSQVLGWSNTTMFTLARANLAVTLDDALDAYRAARDGEGGK